MVPLPPTGHVQPLHPSPCLRVLLAALLCSSLAATGRAQTSVYATVGLANYGFTNLNSSSGTSFKGDTVGIGGGIFYNFPIKSRVTVGVDARLAASPGSKSGFLGGAALRVGFVPHRNPLRPFFQLGGGVVHSSYTQINAVYTGGYSATLVTQNESVTSGAAELVFGLDIRLSPHVDLRAPEYGAEAGGGNGVHAGTGFLNVGLVYHFHPAQPY